MAINKSLNYNPEQNFERPAVPDLSRNNPEFSPENSRSVTEFKEKDEKISMPEIMGGSFNPVIGSSPDNNQFKAVEFIMEDGLDDLYIKMDSLDQQKFKEKGEETANLIMALISKSKVDIKKIFELIKNWLKMIPGVNQFFLEQAAKIKTDKIMAVKNKQTSKWI